MGYITNYVQVGLKMLDIQTYEHFMQNIIVFVGNMIISPQKNAILPGKLVTRIKAQVLDKQSEIRDMEIPYQPVLPSGKRLHNYGKIHHAING